MAMLAIGKALGLVLLFISTNWINSIFDKPQFTVSRQDVALNFSPEVYQLTSMGNNRLLSALMWVQTLLESDTEHYSQKDLNSWLYLRFDHILKLEPKFLAVYMFGGQYLSVIKDDDNGAIDIYTRGLKVYPDNYFLNFNAAFHYLFELNMPAKAIPLYDKVKYHPDAPEYLPSFIGRLKLTQGVELKDIFLVLLEAYNQAPEDSSARIFFEQKLYAIKSQIDLECLNNNQGNCQKKDLDGSPYFKSSNGVYVAKKKWVPYRAK